MRKSDLEGRKRAPPTSGYKRSVGKDERQPEMTPQFSSVYFAAEKHNSK